MAPDSKYLLILAAKRTRRPDVLNKFRIYDGGWDITNKHYWASVEFTGVAGFILAILWSVSFGIALTLHSCCKWQIGVKDIPYRAYMPMLLLLFTCGASAGCILLSVGQDDFHNEMFDTLGFVINQSDFTVQKEIDMLSLGLNSAANTLSEKTNESSEKIRMVIDNVRCALIVIATVMLLLAIVGFLFSICGYEHATFVFILSAWLLVAVTFALCGGFVILNNVVGDACTAMHEWVHYPQAETALSSLLLCVDEQTSNRTLYLSKDMIFQLANVVNTAIWSTANSNRPFYFYNQSGPLVQSLCCPYDSQLWSQQCEPYDVTFDQCINVSESDSCASPGRVTPEIFDQLVAAVNVSHGLDHYAPLLLSLQDCNFVRKTFDSITTFYCPDLEHGLKVVNVGLALVSIGVMLLSDVVDCLFKPPPKGGGVCDNLAQSEGFCRREMKLY